MKKMRWIKTGVLAIALPLLCTTVANAYPFVQTLLSFTNSSSGQGSPVAKLMLGNDNNLYGTSWQGGLNNTGMVFQFTITNTVSGILDGFMTDIYDFTGGDDGANPYAGLYQDNNDTLWGVATGGGTNDNGTLFELQTDGTGFNADAYFNGRIGGQGYNNDPAGSHPYGELTVLDDGTQNDGFLYATANQGGPYSCGTVVAYRSDNGLDNPWNNGPIIQTVHQFTGMGSDGAWPFGPLALLSVTNYNYVDEKTVTGVGVIDTITNTFLTTAWGTTWKGGDFDAGCIYQVQNEYVTVTVIENGTVTSERYVPEVWLRTYQTIYSFTGGSDGANPYAGLILANDGNFYGTTVNGGAYGLGTVFMMTPAGVLTTLHSFSGVGDGAHPDGQLQLGPGSGNLYGTTTYGGNGNNGTIFNVRSTGAFANLYSFTGIDDGANPFAGLTLTAMSRVYCGTTGGSTVNGVGSIYEFIPDAARITVVADPDGGGTVNVGVNVPAGGASTANGIYPVGQLVWISALANTNGNWSFYQWNDGVTANPRAISVPSNDVTYTASFRTNSMVTVLASPVSGGNVTGNGNYPIGSSQQIAGTPAQGWYFVNWNDGNTNSIRTITIPPTNITYTANFSPQLTRISVVAAPTYAGQGYIGTASSTNAGLFIPGSALILGATSSDSNTWVFSNWNDGTSTNPFSITVPTNNTTYTAVFIRKTVQVNIQANPTTGGWVIGGGVYYAGSNDVLTAVASNGWMFIAWNDGVTNNPRTIMTISNVTYVAEFGTAATITVQASPTNGGSVAGSGTFFVGSNDILSATASNGWIFTGWNDGTTNNPYTITVPPTNITYTANFWPLATISVSPSTNLGGTVTGGGIYPVGSNIILTATASNGWAFVGWSDGTPTNNYPVTVASNITYTADFLPLYTVTALAYPTNGGTVTGSGTYVMGSNATVSVTATNAGFIFMNWNGSTVNTNSSWTFAVVSNGTVCTANFAYMSTVTALANPTNGGSVSGGGAYLSGTTNVLTASPSNTWIFTGWSDGLTNNPRSIIVPFTNITYVADFVQTASIAVAVNTNIGGSVLGSGIYTVGSNAVLTVIVSNGWAFTGWSDSNGNNPRTIVVPLGGGNYTADFAPAATVTLLGAPANGGSVSGGGVYLLGSNAVISATAATGWKFTGWNDGNTNNSRSFPVVSNITFLAGFYTNACFYLEDTSGNVTKWSVNGQGLLQQFAYLTGNGGWNLKAVDVIGDLFWQHPAGWEVTWLIQTNGSYKGLGFGNMGAWVLCAVADVDGDGVPDLIWQHPTGWVTVWYMNPNNTVRSTGSLGNMGAWQLKAASDINRDGKADLFWQNPAGSIVVSLSQPSGAYQGVGLGNLGAWGLRAVRDVDGDGIPDLILQNPADWVVVWYMNSNSTPRAAAGLGNTGAAKIMAVE